MASESTATVPSVGRALTVLEVLAESRNGYTLSDLGRRLGLPKSSLHTMLRTLGERGYVLRNPATHRFRLGLRLFTLANLALNELGLVEQASPLLRLLMERTRLTVHMAVRERGEAVLVEKIDPPGIPRLATWVGKRMDLHCTGVGKALLAYMPQNEFQLLVKNYGFTRYNENTITSIQRLRAECEQIRRVGHSSEDEEGEIGFRCVGAPVFDHTGNVVAAISVAGTTTQITVDNSAMYVDLVKQTGEDISQSLGYTPRATEVRVVG
jgi:DNA-binding IclR family transcriptional regulator